MIRNSGVDASGWVYWRNVALSTVQASAIKNGARTFSLDRLPKDGFNGRVRDLARASAKLRAGRFGMFVKPIGGPASVSLGADRRFEPASVMKILHHLYLHTRLEANPAEDLNATV